MVVIDSELSVEPLTEAVKSMFVKSSVPLKVEPELRVMFAVLKGGVALLFVSLISALNVEPF